MSSQNKDLKIFDEIVAIVNHEKAYATPKMKYITSQDKIKEAIGTHLNNLFKDIRTMVNNNYDISISGNDDVSIKQSFQVNNPQDFIKQSFDQNNLAQQIESLRIMIKQQATNDPSYITQEFIIDQLKIIQNNLLENEKKFEIEQNNMKQMITKLEQTNLTQKIEELNKVIQDQQLIITDLLKEFKAKLFFQEQANTKLLSSMEVLKTSHTSIHQSNQGFQQELRFIKMLLLQFTHQDTMTKQHNSTPLPLPQLVTLPPQYSTPIPQPIARQQYYKFDQINMRKMQIVANKHFQVLSDPIQVNFFEDKGQHHRVILKSQNGHFLVGGDYKSLLLLDSNLQLLSTMSVQGMLKRGISADNYFYCWTSAEPIITIIQQDPLLILDSIQIQNNPYKMISIDSDYIWIGEDYGYYDIINTKTQKIVCKGQLASKSGIRDITLLDSQTKEYAVATDKGINIIHILLNHKDGIKIIDTKESHLKNQDILCIEMIKQNVLAVGVDGAKELWIYDRKSRDTVKCGSFDGRYNSIQKILCYNQETMPFILVKDRSTVKVINAKKMKVESFISCPYEEYPRKESLLQVEELGDTHQIKVVTLSHFNDIKQRIIISLIIAEDV